MEKKASPSFKYIQTNHNNDNISKVEIFNYNFIHKCELLSITQLIILTKKHAFLFLNY